MPSPSGFAWLAKDSAQWPYWNGHAYFAASDDVLRDYAIKNGQLTLNASSAMKFANPVATPTVSSDGNKNAVVWAIATKIWNGPDATPTVLYAYDAANSARLSTLPSRTPPAIAPP